MKRPDRLYQPFTDWQLNGRVLAISTGDSRVKPKTWKLVIYLLSIDETRGLSSRADMLRESRSPKKHFWKFCL